MFCTSCGNNNVDGAAFCNGCGGALNSNSLAPTLPADGQGPMPMSAPAVGQPQPQGYAQGQPAPYGQPQPGAHGQGQPDPYGRSGQYMHGHQPGVVTRTSGMAIAGFVLSFFCGLLGLIFSLIGYNECKASDGTVGGEGLALAGIIISIVAMLLGLAIAVGGA